MYNHFQAILVNYGAVLKYLIGFLIFFNFVFADTQYGICEIDTLDTQSAKECIQRVLKKDPKNIQCIVKLANLYLRQGELSKGFELIYEAYTLNPQAVQKSAVASILPFALKISALKENALQEENPNAWNEIGDSFYDMGVYKEALEAYENSVKIDKNQEEIVLKLALCYKKVGQNYGALENLKEVIRLNKDNFYANYYLGKILKYSFQDSGNATKYLQKAKELLQANENLVSAKEYPQFLSDIIFELSK